MLTIPWRDANRTLTVGIDIDGNTIRLVALKKISAITNTFELISYVHLAATREFPSINEALCSAFQQAGISKKSKIVIALPYGQVLIKTMQCNAVDNLSELENQIIAHCAQMITYPVHEACIDFEVIKNNKNSPGACDVRIVIARSDAVEEKINLFAASNFSIAAVDIESDALARAVCYFLNREQKISEQQIIAVMHLSSQKLLGLVLYRENILFAQEVILYVTDPAGIKPEHYLEKIKTLFPILSMAAKHFLKTGPSGTFFSGNLYLSGCQLFGKEFVSDIEFITDKKTCLVDPFSGMEIKQWAGTKGVEKFANSLVVSCGLAMRDFHNDH